VCLALALAGCASSNPTLPVVPDAPPVSGSWTGEVVFADVTGGECLGSTLQELVGVPVQFGGALTQSGTDVTGTLDIDHTGAVCTYHGSISGQSLKLMSTSCAKAELTPITCPNGQVRNLLPQASTVKATIDGDRISGVFIETDDLVAAGTSASVGTLVATSSFIAQRQ
jgi:hypothetical protein